MNRLEDNSVKFVLYLWIMIFVAGTIFYPLQDYSSLDQQDLYPASLGIAVFVSLIIMFYLLKLHHMMFKPKIIV